MTSIDDAQTPILPVVAQPPGWQYYSNTWSGRIITINALVFIWMIYLHPSSFFSPSLDVVRSFGSKSIADIALGEYWRYVTPIFVHFGIIHLVFNMLGIYYIGYQIEHLLGPKWFLSLYLLAGITGNLASCIFSLAPSAGASGAIFGLLGAGFRLERLINEKFEELGIQNRPRKKIYSGMVLTNIALGLIIPVIDNAAHIGGLVAGWLLMEAFLRTEPNRVRRPSKLVVISIYFSIFVFAAIAVFRSANQNIVIKRLIKSSGDAKSAAEMYMNLTDAINIQPLNVEARLLRGRLLIQNGEVAYGINDIKLAISTGKTRRDNIEKIAIDLRETGHRAEADLILELASKIESN
jgi:rhomboid protease GluP